MIVACSFYFYSIWVGGSTLKRDAGMSNFEWKFFWILIGSACIMTFLEWWMIHTPFPKPENRLPRDVADKIEPYKWRGFGESKYKFFQKDGKLGIVDIARFYVVVPAKYDLILWREQDKTIDVIENGEKKTLEIKEKEYRDVCITYFLLGVYVLVLIIKKIFG